MKKHVFLRIALVFAVALVITGGMLAISNGGLLAAEPRPKAADVPNATLIVGTHLIALSAVTDEITQVAEASATTSSQNKVYYRSEIDSTWYDITNTEKVLQTPVSFSVIDELITKTLTHWTKDDGKTYDLATGAVVKIHELRDLAKPKTVIEADSLSTLKQVQENLAKNEKDETAKARLDFSIILLDDLIRDIDAKTAQSQCSSLKASFSGINGNSFDDFRMKMIMDGGGGIAEVMEAFKLNESAAAMKIIEYNLAKAAEAGEEEEEEDDAKKIAEQTRKNQLELRTYYRILAMDAEATIAGAADLPTKRTDIDSYDNFVIYLRGQKEQDTLVELAVAEKAQLQASYDIACVMVMIEKLNACLSLAKALPAEDVSAVLTEVLNSYQSMLGELEAILRGEPNTVLLEIFQEKADSMTASVRGASYSGAHATLKSLAFVQYCLDNTLIDKDGELAVLNEAIPRSIAKINDYFKAGQNRVYEKNINGDEVRSYALAKADKSPPAALEGIMNTGIADNKSLLDEYTMLLDLYKKRGELEEHTNLIRSGITTFEALAKTLPQDDFRVEDYKLLMDLVNKLYAMMGENVRMMDDEYQQQLQDEAALQEELNRLNNEYLDAMLDGKFDQAAELLATIQSLMSQGASYSDDLLNEYLELDERDNLLDGLLADLDAQELLPPPEGMTKEEYIAQINEQRDALLTEKRSIQDAINALKEQDPLIAAMDGAGGAGAMSGGGLSSDGGAGAGGDGSGAGGTGADGSGAGGAGAGGAGAGGAGGAGAGSPGSAGNLSSLVMALVQQYGLDMDGNVLADLILSDNLPTDDGLLLAMMRPVLERQLLQHALDSGLLDEAGQAAAEDLLERTLTTIINNELNKYSLDELVSFYQSSSQFGDIGHETAALRNNAVILGYTQKCLRSPVLMFRGVPYVPIHDTMAYFGGETVHLKDRDRAVVQAPGLYVEFTAGESQVYVNDILDEMPGPVLDYNFVLYAPAAFIADMMGIPWEFITQDTPLGDEPVFIFYYFQ